MVLNAPQGLWRVYYGPQNSKDPIEPTGVLRGPKGSSGSHKGPRGFTRVLNAPQRLKRVQMVQKRPFVLNFHMSRYEGFLYKSNKDLSSDELLITVCQVTAFLA